MKRIVMFVAVLVAVAVAAVSVPSGFSGATRFKVRIENVSAGSGQVVSISPGVWLLHNAFDPLFTAGLQSAGRGLQHLAERGNPVTLARALGQQDGVLSKGIFDDVADGAGPTIDPGEAFEFTVTAKPGQMLSFAARLSPSDDLFVAPDGTGIRLFDVNDAPIAGDVTSEVYVWDAGTVEKPAAIPATATAGVPEPRANGHADPAASSGAVRLVSDNGSSIRAAEILRVTVTPKR